MKRNSVLHRFSSLIIRVPIDFGGAVFYLTGLILVIVGNIKCTKESLSLFSSKVETIITDYNSIYTDSIQVFLEPTPCNDNSFTLGVKYFDKTVHKAHEFTILYYGYKKQKMPKNRPPICTNISLEEKRNFTPFFYGVAFYFEDDVASTFYALDTNRINSLDVDFSNRFQHKIKFDLNLVKTIGPGRNSLGPGIDSLHIIAPEFLAKVWFWH